MVLFDLTQSPPKPSTLDDSHKLIVSLWNYLRRLQEKLNCNSNNSSLAPSQDKFKKLKMKPDNDKSWKERTSNYWKKRKQGAQKGHKDIGRKLLPAEEVDTIISCPPNITCPSCKGFIVAKAICRRKQIFDITMNGIHITEYQIYKGQCLLGTQQRLFYWYEQIKHSKKPYAKRYLIDCVKHLYHYLKKGSKLLRTSTARFCTNLLRNRKSLWHFLKNPAIDPTNNLAERNLRHAVLWRKKTYGTRSQRGNRFVEWMLTVMMIVKK